MKCAITTKCIQIGITSPAEHRGGSINKQLNKRLFSNVISSPKLIEASAPAPAPAPAPEEKVEKIKKKAAVVSEDEASKHDENDASEPESDSESEAKKKKPAGKNVKVVKKGDDVDSSDKKTKKTVKRN